MKILIEITDDIYEHAKDTSEDSNDEFTAMRAIAHGTPINDGGKIIGFCKYESALLRILKNQKVCNGFEWGDDDGK